MLINPHSILMKKKRSIALQQGVTVSNAGVVLLNSYFLMLFERLNLVKNHTFKSNTKNVLIKKLKLEFLFSTLSFYMVFIIKIIQPI